jgi:hypothetical protein
MPLVSIDSLKQDYRLVELKRPEEYAGSYCFVMSKKYPEPLEYRYNSEGQEEFIFPSEEGTFSLTMESLVNEGSIIGHDRKANNAWTQAQLVVLESLDIPTEDIEYFLPRYYSFDNLKAMVEKWSPWYYIESYEDHTAEYEGIIFEIVPIHVDALGLKGFTSNSVGEVYKKIENTSKSRWGIKWDFKLPQDAILMYE